MSEKFFKSILVVIFLLNFSTSLYANYYTDIRKIERKIYVAKKQQEMLNTRLAVEKKKIFNARTVKAYEEKIASFHDEEMQYKSEKSELVGQKREQKAYERKMEKQLDSISGDIYVDIDLVNQTMNVYKGSTAIYSWLCSTGRKGYKTPEGNYTPYHAVKMHHSKQWDDAPMPYSVFFHQGFAIHGTNYVSRLGRRASHGCVRLSTTHAKKFYSLTRKYGYKRVHIDIVN